MGNCTSNESNKKTKRTKELDKQLEKEKIKSALELKILCLGAGESGKSTFLKQLKNIYNKKEPLTAEETNRYIDIVHTNIRDSIACLLNICARENLNTEGIKDKVKIMSEANQLEKLKPGEKDAVRKLWGSEVIREAFSLRVNHYLPDSTIYYFENIDRLLSEDYQPTVDDIIMSRVRTTGMVITNFHIPPIEYKVIDVGGQRSERKKWLRAFDNVEAIIYIVNLAGYRTVLFEDESKNRLIESLDLFEEIIQSNFFNNIPIFLFFNKKDLFEEYLKENDISLAFPHYNGNGTTMDQMEFICHKFEDKVIDKNMVKGTNYISARYKKDVKYAYEDVMRVLERKYEKDIEKAVKLK